MMQSLSFQMKTEKKERNEDRKEREITHGSDGTDDESDTGTVKVPDSDTNSDVESVDLQNQQDGPTGQGRK